MGCFHSKTQKASRKNSVREGEKPTNNESVRPRLSAQIFPVCETSVVRVPDFNLELKYSFLSLKGHTPSQPDKLNQDSYCISTQFGNDPNDHFFGVFDGHGEFGTECSHFVQENLPLNLLQTPDLNSDIEKAFHAAFAITNGQLHESRITDVLSGTTAITVLVRGKTLYVANVGDSRAIMAERRGTNIVAVDLSSDQTPYRADELERIKRCGGIVLTVGQMDGKKDPNVQFWGSEEDDGGDPPRVWVPHNEPPIPGCAFTRSVGDSLAETVGVNAEPEVNEVTLKPNNPFFVIASDGVTEFLSSQDVVDTIAKFEDPQEACTAIAASSYRSWLNNDMRVDDITIIVVQIKDL